MQNKIFYDKKKYKDSNAIFQNFIQSCIIISPEKKSFTDFKISTITCITSIAESVNVKEIFDLLNIDKIADIAYIISKNNIKGIKTIKKKNSVIKKKKNKNKLFFKKKKIIIL